MKYVNGVMNASLTLGLGQRMESLCTRGIILLRARHARWLNRRSLRKALFLLGLAYAAE